MLHISRGTWIPILQLDHFIIPRCEFFEEKEAENVVEEVSREDSSPKDADALSSAESSSTASATDDDDPPMLPQKMRRKTRHDPLQQQQ
jgi:hypothetical protein